MLSLFVVLNKNSNNKRNKNAKPVHIAALKISLSAISIGPSLNTPFGNISTLLVVCMITLAARIDMPINAPQHVTLWARVNLDLCLSRKGENHICLFFKLSGNFRSNIRLEFSKLFLVSGSKTHSTVPSPCDTSSQRLASKCHVSPVLM